jgi:hypothetical protein
LQFCFQLNTHIPVRLVRAGLGEKKTTAKLAKTSPQGSQSFINDDFGETIPLTTLADAWDTKSGNIDLWVLDVEGYEIFALKGALPLLQKGLIKSIYIEADPSENSRQALSLLKNLRWRLYRSKTTEKSSPSKTIHRFTSTCSLFPPPNVIAHQKTDLQKQRPSPRLRSAFMTCQFFPLCENFPCHERCGKPVKCHPHAVADCRP